MLLACLSLYVCFAGAFAKSKSTETSKHQPDIEEALHTTALPSEPTQLSLRGETRSLAELCTGLSLVPCGVTGSRVIICSRGLTARCISNDSGLTQYMQISNSVCGRCPPAVCIKGQNGVECCVDSDCGNTNEFTCDLNFNQCECKFECCDDSDCTDPNNPTCSPSENICFNTQKRLPMSALLTWNGNGSCFSRFLLYLLTDNLYLFLQTPAGELIYFENRVDLQTGGFLDNDEKGTGTLLMIRSNSRIVVVIHILPLSTRLSNRSELKS
jgi:hypothetical protein